MGKGGNNQTVEKYANEVLRTTTNDKRLTYAKRVLEKSTDPQVNQALEKCINGKWEFDMPKKGKAIQQQLKQHLGNNEELATKILEEILEEAKKDPPNRKEDNVTDCLPQDVELRKQIVRKVAQETSDPTMKAYLESIVNNCSFRKEAFFKNLKNKNPEVMRDTWSRLIEKSQGYNQAEAQTPKPKGKTAFKIWLEEKGYSTKNQKEHYGRLQEFESMPASLKAYYEEKAAATSGVGVKNEPGECSDGSSSQFQGQSYAQDSARVIKEEPQSSHQPQAYGQRPPYERPYEGQRSSYASYDPSAYEDQADGHHQGYGRQAYDDRSYNRQDYAQRGHSHQGYEDRSYGGYGHGQGQPQMSHAAGYGRPSYPQHQQRPPYGAYGSGQAPGPYRPRHQGPNQHYRPY